MIINVDKDQAGQRIDMYLTGIIDKSRSSIQKMLKNKQILVNDKEVKNKYSIEAGDSIYIEDVIEEEYHIEAQNIPLNIKYEDDYLIVVDKPANMVVHPAVGNYDNTLVNALMYYSKSLSDINGDFRPGIVHRIDKDTSGLLIVAKNNEVHQKLADMIRNKEIKREYKAIIHGSLLEKEAKIIAPIGRDVKDRKKMSVTDKNSKDATTLIYLIDNNENYSLIRCALLTGRTHQIRVHLKYINHPVVGDPKYGQKKTIDTKGQALHAYKLEFIHPITGEMISLRSELPQEFNETLEKVNLKDK